MFYCKSIVSFLLLLCCVCVGGRAADFVNLTPKPFQMMKGEGKLMLSPSFVFATNDLPPEMVQTVVEFSSDFNREYAYQTSTTSTDAAALIQVRMADATMETEAYRLNVTTERVEIEASAPAGVFYALQTIRKMAQGDREKSLPVVRINDKPRFAYRGFMLDVARHFFSVQEVKKFIDLMALYKLNRFHWHLTDDQGWRVEIKKYPRLTTVGATAPNSYFTDMKHGGYNINRQYGPYFYTQDEIRDVVAYARARHIEIVPEIDMPGHFVAAMAAYPEFSCWPNGAHQVWSNGGISSDVMNVANARAVQFAKDILAEIIELFPYEQIHIGGDECPTSAWENNAECQALYKKLGLTHYRQLQSYFIREMASFIAEKGRKTSVWNESITAEGADVQLIRETGATVYCWQPSAPAARKAAGLGLDNIVTPWGPYYINRKQSKLPDEPSAAGDGSDNLAATYNYIPVPTDLSATAKKHYVGIQGTFWTEHVADTAYLEYLALPRLFAIAETGWTQQNAKNYNDFVKRITADAPMLDRMGFNYCKHDLALGGTAQPMVLPKVSTAEQRHYYRIITKATDARKDRCMELLQEGSPLIAANAGKGADIHVLWTNAQASEGAANYDAQLWTLEEDVAHPGRFALVCKAMPDGSVLPDPTQRNNGGRWCYDTAAKHYNFILGEQGYGQTSDGYYYSLRSDAVGALFLNAALSSQGMALNLWNNPSEGQAGLWLFASMSGNSQTTYDVFPTLEAGQMFRFTNTISPYAGRALFDDGQDAVLRHTSDTFVADAWEVLEAMANADGSQSVKLRNVQTQRCISGIDASDNGVGYSVRLGKKTTFVQLRYDAETTDFTFALNSKVLYPVDVTTPYTIAAGTVSGGVAGQANRQPIRPQGTAWQMERVRVVSFDCVDERGTSLGTFQRALPLNVPVTASHCPHIAHHRIQKLLGDGVNTPVRVLYERTAYGVQTILRDTQGAIISVRNDVVPVGHTFTPSLDVPACYMLVRTSHPDGVSFMPTGDTAIEAIFSTHALSGVKRVGKVVSSIEDGHSYLLYDCSPADINRKGFRRVDPLRLRVGQSTFADDTTPLFTWTLRKEGNRYTVQNEWCDAYIPELTQSKEVLLSDRAGRFSFTLNPDAATWRVQGSNQQYWDGFEGGMTGWHTYGHPYRIHEYEVQPYFTVTLVMQDEKGNRLFTITDFVRAGDNYTLIAPQMEEYTLSSIVGNENLEKINDFRTITLNYQSPTGIRSATSASSITSSSPFFYDLSGRRVAPHRPGFYIQNGRKVLIR